MKKKIFYSVLFVFSIFCCNSQSNESLSKNGSLIQRDCFVEIPFQYINKHIFIDVDINNKKYTFLFDSACEINAIDKSISNEIGYNLLKKIDVSGSSITKNEVDLIEIFKISISNLDYENTNGFIQDLTFIKKNYENINVQGIIGNNLMRKSNWQIDYKNKIIRISDKTDKFSFSKTDFIIELSKKKWGLGYIDLKIDSKKHKFIFDTGSSGRFTANKSFIKYFNDSNENNSDLEKLIVNTQNIKLGNVELKNEKISLENGVSSLIGNDFFQDYILTIDWSNNLIYLSTQN